MSVFSVVLCILGGAVIGSSTTFIAMVLAFAAGEKYDKE